MKLILASASPRRAALLRQAGFAFEAITPSITEELSFATPPEEQVLDLARRKANSAAEKLRQGLILAADTVVFCRGRILGKPAGTKEAREMLEFLSGKVHRVLTAIVLLDAATGKSEEAFSVTRVWFKNLSEEDIDNYIKSGEPFDKAGAYGIQGPAARFVEKIEGCYTNVVGLPLGLLDDMLKKMQ